MPNIRSYRELRVYQNAFKAAMRIFELTKNFPVEEKYSMVDQIRRSSRAVWPPVILTASPRHSLTASQQK